MSAFKSTLAFGVPVTKEDGSATGTLLGYVANEARPRGPVELDDTLDGAHLTSAAPLTQTINPRMTQTRTTVLPRRARTPDGATEHVADERPRFMSVRQLGEGAMGTVELQRDNDIRRTVAVKKLREEARFEGALLRFADEVRIVGQLEHPCIVPIYDVGRDEAGDVYLVMKHLEGETMESVIEKLRAGDPAYTARFSIQFRAHLFLQVLDAMRYAHARGILHRDLKPANIMIGRYDEVTVMDWGVAKPFGAKEAAAPARDPKSSLIDSVDQRLLQTQLGALAGTPFYMSPEQAAGMNDALDDRSDVFALGLVFFEWLTLHHPLEKKTTLMEVLASLITTEIGRDQLVPIAIEAGVPCEYIYVLVRALRRDRDERTKDVATFYDQLKSIMEGRIQVECPVTFTKRATSGAMRWVDRHPYGFMALAFLGTLTMLAGLVSLAVNAVQALG